MQYDKAFRDQLQVTHIKPVTDTLVNSWKVTFVYLDFNELMLRLRQFHVHAMLKRPADGKRWIDFCLLAPLVRPF